MKINTRVLDLVFFVLGPVLIVLGVFSFGYEQLLGDNSISVAYEYGTQSLLALCSGTTLIALGLVRRWWRQDPP